MTPPEMGLVRHGEVIDVSRDAEVDALHDEIRTLRTELSIAKRDADRAKADAERALAALRKQLSPLYRALQGVFGELDAAGVAETTGSPMPSRTSAVWENWKTKLGPMPARFIDALMLHGDMNVAQLRIACACGQQTVYDNIAKLNKAGLINKAGGRYSLKQL